MPEMSHVATDGPFRLYRHSDLTGDLDNIDFSLTLPSQEADVWVTKVGVYMWNIATIQSNLVKRAVLLETTKQSLAAALVDMALTETGMIAGDDTSETVVAFQYRGGLLLPMGGSLVLNTDEVDTNATPTGKVEIFVTCTLDAHRV